MHCCKRPTKNYTSSQKNFIIFTLDMCTSYKTKIHSSNKLINNLHKNYTSTVNTYYICESLDQFQVFNDDKHLSIITQSNWLLQIEDQILFWIKICTSHNACLKNYMISMEYRNILCTGNTTIVTTLICKNKEELLAKLWVYIFSSDLLIEYH